MDINFLYLVVFLVTFLASVEIINNKVALSVLGIQVVVQIFLGNFLLAFLIILIAIYILSIKHYKKNTLKLINAREKHFKSLANYSLQPLILKNKYGEVIFASDSLKKNLGLTKGIKPGELLSEIIHPDDISEHKLFLSQVIDQPFEKKSIELRLKKNKSEHIWVRLNCINLLEHKYVKAIVTSLEDITSQKNIDYQKSAMIQQESQARNVAENAVRQRDEFLSIASHELKTPLTSIILQLQSTLKKLSTQSLVDFSGADLLNSMQIAEKQSQRLSTLIKDLLNVSIASTGRISINKEKVKLSDLITTIVDRHQEEINLSDIKLKVEMESDKISGNWDPIRIEQAISNILINAMKHAHGKDINLKVRMVSSWAAISIKDKGKGIKEKNLKTIFEPFKKINEDNSGEGLGVGLFIAKQIAKAHGGDISVDSKIGEGTTFTIWLPAIIEYSTN